MNPKTILLSMLTMSALLAHSQPPVLPATNKKIAFASDTQAPMWVETLWLRSNNNRRATKEIFGSIQAGRPASLFLLGDVVNLGYSNRQWRPMDRYIRNLRDSSIGVNAILGNHEVMGQSRKGQKKFQKRFPNHKRTGYVEIIDSVAIVLLNSNIGKLSPAEDRQQTNWYKNVLEELGSDSSVAYIITACHHSPYTNSRIVRPSKEVQERFVPAFLASPKSCLFLSGHCHNFEHYRVEGKDFLVIGGGGGLHQPLRQGADALPDLAGSYKPLFHYLTLERTEGGLEVTSLQLKKDFSGFENGLQLKIAAPATRNTLVAAAAN